MRTMKRTIHALSRVGGAATTTPKAASPVRHARALVLALAAIGAAPVLAQTIPTRPADLSISAERNLFVGNATRVVTAAGVPAPVGGNGSVTLDERVRTGAVYARKGVKTRLLAEVVGDVTATEGPVQFANQTHVHGDVVARDGVVVGVSSLVDGAVASVENGVRIVRLARVRGDVFAQRDFRGERDVVVGSPGTTVEVKGNAMIRDRGEYFAAILHEGALTLAGNGAPLLHASVVQVAPGTLAPPAMVDWRLERLASTDVDPGTQDLVVTRQPGGTSIPPGRYGTLVLEQEATAVLDAGTYEFEAIEAKSDARFVVGLDTPGSELRLLVAGDLKLGRRLRLVTGGGDVASRITTYARGTFRGDQDVVWQGGVGAEKAVVLGKHTALTGAVWSRGDVQVGRDSTIVWVPAAVE